MQESKATMKKKHPLIKLIEQGEHQQLDFKFCINDSRKIAKSLSAFANSDGGRLLIGIKDNGKIAGIRSEEELYMVEAAANVYCKPNLKVKTERWKIEDKDILEVIVSKMENPPCLALNEDDKWRAYIRKNDENILAHRVLLKVWQNRIRKEGVKVYYTQAEKMLLSYLREEKYITIQTLKRIAKISKYKAERILSNMIIINAIGYEIEKDGIRFYLKENEL